jgi:hypothetical protein
MSLPFNMKLRSFSCGATVDTPSACKIGSVGRVDSSPGARASFVGDPRGAMPAEQEIQRGAVPASAPAQILSCAYYQVLGSSRQPS